MSDDKDNKDIKDEDLDKVAGGTRGEVIRAPGGGTGTTPPGHREPPGGTGTTPPHAVPD